MSQRRTILTMAAIVLLAGARSIAGTQIEVDTDAQDAALLRAGIVRGRLDARLIPAWNSLAHDIAFAEDQFLTFKGQRALAMMHLAMHDALNSIVPLYDRYAYTGPLVIGHPIAAAAQSAHDVLLAEYPNQRDQIDGELRRWLPESAPALLRERGIELGHAVAVAVTVLRTGDGWDFPGSYSFGDVPGDYQTTPPWNGFVAQPGFRFAKPFALASPSQFRPPPPPQLASPAYARAFREVKDYGAASSAVRTEDQTAYAIWWMEFAEGSVNRLTRQLVAEHGTDLWTAARLFSHVGMALYDGYVAVWDSKYEYNYWRPYTAIRAADADGNPRTMSDPAWEPLRPTSPFPEYASAHATACAASLTVIEKTLGDQSFTMETTTAPPGMPTRTFASFRAAAQECADSRVRLGWHLRYAIEAGANLGRDVARHVLRHTLRPHSRRGDR